MAPTRMMSVTTVQVVKLPGSMEFDLLYTLLLNTDRVLTRERLLEQVWGFDYAGDTRAVDSAIKRLRAELRSADPQAAMPFPFCPKSRS